MNIEECLFRSPDDNIAALRAAYPDGLHFVVGDIHGASKTLRTLLQKIRFDPERDHVYYLGDYVGGGNLYALLDVLNAHYEPDYSRPGFHLIRGNHEWFMAQGYPLDNLPDILVLRSKVMDYYLVHSGMLANVFTAIGQDMDAAPDQTVFAYKLDPAYAGNKGAPLVQLLWSRNGLYTTRMQGRLWPAEQVLHIRRACILHGHAPFSYFRKAEYVDYGGETGSTPLFWEDQHVLFCEEMQSFNLDADVKGKNKNNNTYRGLACLCLEGCNEAALRSGGILTVEGIRSTPNFLFGTAYEHEDYYGLFPLPDRILEARPERKTITMDPDRTVRIC
ncbi:MAG: metallophosphoesterase [Oscillospiraceae bacterium]|nr:metallophosphoesterase [Oscillospiraceae bacterium]